MRGLGGESLDRSRQLGDGKARAAFEVLNEGGSSAFVVICDHAGRALPPNFDLGVAPAEMDRHIAWDIGAGALSLLLGQRLDACVVRQPYSRLVIDCNRSPARADATPEVSDGTVVPANRGLSPEQKAERVAAIHEPYHRRIAQLLDARAAAGRPTALVLMHSFTPMMAGFSRPWGFGVLHTGQPLALAALRRLRHASVGEIGDNQPYVMDEVDYTAARHGGARGLDFVELEVRQDLIADPEGQAAVADLLAEVLPAALVETGGGY